MPENLQNEIRLYTETEFEDYIFDNGKMKVSSTDEINSLYNDDKYDPRDGKLVKAADELSALIEADIALRNGSIHDEFAFAKSKLKKKYIKIDKIGGWLLVKIRNSYTYSNYGKKTATRRQRDGKKSRPQVHLALCCFAFYVHLQIFHHKNKNVYFCV